MTCQDLENQNLDFLRFEYAAALQAVPNDKTLGHSDTMVAMIAPLLQALTKAEIDLCADAVEDYIWTH